MPLRPRQLEHGALAQLAEVEQPGERVVRLVLAALVQQAQVVQGDVGLVGELREQPALLVGVEAVLVVQVAGDLLTRVALELAHGVAEAPAHGLLGEHLGPGDALEHAVDDAALHVAHRRAGGTQVLAAQTALELDEHALLVELDLEVAELHLREPVLEALDRGDAEVAAGALAGEVDGRPRALSEDLGQDRELEQADQRRRRRGVGRRARQHLAGVRPHATFLGGRERDDAAQRTREHARQRHLFLGTQRHSCPLGDHTRATHSRAAPLSASSPHARRATLPVL